MNTNKSLVPFSAEWKAFVANATAKAPNDRSAEEREAIALAETDDSDADASRLHFGIRCERDGTGKLSPAVAWYKEGGKTRRFATLSEAQQIAASLDAASPACLHYEARPFVIGLEKEPKLSDATLGGAMRLWASQHSGLAEAVCQAQAFAAAETERVDKYIDPIFAEFEFLDSDGKKITHRDDLYLSTDGAKVHEFWARCDLAHRANGFTGELGVWPNLRADHLRMQAENALVKSFCDFIGARSQPWGKKFQHLLKLLLTVCHKINSAESK